MLGRRPVRLALRERSTARLARRLVAHAGRVGVAPSVEAALTPAEGFGYAAWVRRLLILALFAACTEGPVPLPDLSGARALLVGPREGGSWTALALGDDDVRIELPVALTDGAHGDLLLFEQTLEELQLDPGAFSFSSDPRELPLPTPAHAYALDASREWITEDPARFAGRRLPPRRCWDIEVVASVPLDLLGGSTELFPWSEREVLAVSRTETNQLFANIVSRDHATPSREVTPPSFYATDLAIDDRGGVWVAWTSTTGDPRLELVELDRALEPKRPTVTLSLEELGPGPHTIEGMLALTGTAAPELLFLFVPEDHEQAPAIARWRGGSARLHRLPWSAEPISVRCPNTGYFRHYLERRDAETRSVWFASGKLVHVRGDALELEAIDEEACGGVLADGRYASGFALPDLFEGRVRARVRAANGGWERWPTYASDPRSIAALSGRSVIRYGDRYLATGLVGALVELQRRSDAVYACPPVQIAPAGALNTTLVLGDELVVSHGANPTERPTIEWVRVLR